jgi:hypothetical protein
MVGVPVLGDGACSFGFGSVVTVMELVTFQVSCCGITGRAMSVRHYSVVG